MRVTTVKLEELMARDDRASHACATSWSEAVVAPRAPPGGPYLPLPLILGEVHLFEDLRALFHYQCLLIGVR